MKRLIDINRSEASKIRARQRSGTMTELVDDEDYLCYDEAEYANWKPTKNGRKKKKI